MNMTVNTWLLAITGALDATGACSYATPFTVHCSGTVCTPAVARTAAVSSTTSSTNSIVNVVTLLAVIEQQQQWQ
jgi:hypothetical protein